MAKMIQVRNVPAWLHRELVRRARSRGETMTQFVQGVLEREVARPLAEEVFARVRARSPVALDRPVAEIVRSERAQRAGGSAEGAPRAERSDQRRRDAR